MIEIIRKYLGEDFNFRRGQEATIKAIWDHYKKHPEGTVVISAPTGSGKSWIAYALSALMREEHNTGYIIASDLALHQQYENDIFKLRLNYGSVKGIDNYNCSVNGLTFSLGECKIRGLSYKKTQSLACYDSCGYYQARRRAMESSVSVLTYAYWLIQLNYVYEKMDEPPFGPRQYTIFDECHKIPDIVQNHFAPYIAERDFEKFERLERYLNERRIFDFTFNPQLIVGLYNALRRETDVNRINEYLISFERLLLPILTWGDAYRDSLKETYKNQDLPKELYGIFKIIDWIKDMHCKVQDFNRIHKDRTDGIVKVMEDKALKFYTLYETDLIQKHLLKKCGFKVLMSATIGDPLKFLKIIGASDTLYLSVPSTFDYTKSPINIMTKYRMSYKDKETSYPKVLEMMDRILEKHKDDKGIIHTGSYELNQRILRDSRNGSRLYSYSNSKEKEAALEAMNLARNAVITGPSLTEGLNLEDDKSRFQIILKVPYPSLTDELVKARMNKNGDWYSWATSLAIMQAIGRSVRNPEDWAQTYILDACFLDLDKNVQWPKWFKERFKLY